MNENEYHKGRLIQGQTALGVLADKKAVYCNDSLIKWDKELLVWDGTWKPICTSLEGPFFVAVFTPEYKLNFIEAWSAMKEDKTIEREDGEVFTVDKWGELCSTDGNVQCTHEVVEAKYRVLK